MTTLESTHNWGSTRVHGKKKKQYRVVSSHKLNALAFRNFNPQSSGLYCR